MIHLLIFYNNKKMFTLTQQLENNHPVVVSVPNLQYRKLLTEVLCFSIKKLHQFYSLFRSSRTIFTMRRRNKFSCLFYTSMLNFLSIPLTNFLFDVLQTPLPLCFLAPCAFLLVEVIPSIGSHCLY